MKTTPSSPIRLVNPTNRDLETAFSIYVAGWQIDARHDGYWIPPGKKPLTRGYYTEDPPSYVKSFDAVLPYLEAWRKGHPDSRLFNLICDWQGYRAALCGDDLVPIVAYDPTSPARAAVIALLRSNGVTVEINP